MFTLYGSLTSPSVRKVRIHTHFMGMVPELVNTADDEGQGRLRAISPLWQVPVVQWNADLLLDSRVIVSTLWQRCGQQALANDAVEYSKRNPSIDPLLFQFEIKQKPTAAAPAPTVKPAPKPGTK